MALSRATRFLLTFARCSSAFYLFVYLFIFFASHFFRSLFWRDVIVRLVYERAQRDATHSQNASIKNDRNRSRMGREGRGNRNEVSNFIPGMFRIIREGWKRGGTGGRFIRFGFGRGDGTLFHALADVRINVAGMFYLI